MNTPSVASADVLSPIRRSGVLLAVTAAIEVVFMAMHPTSHSHDAAAFAQEAVRGIPGNASVHGVLIGLSLVMIVGAFGVAQFLGASRLLVRAGLVAFIAGSACAFGAGLINGFVLTAVASRLANEDVHALTAALELCRAANTACARASVVLMSSAPLLWSCGLFARGGVARAVAVIACVCGAVPIALLGTEKLPMTVNGYGAFLLAQAAWFVCVGILMARAR